jgi:hypothetical protein
VLWGCNDPIAGPSRLVVADGGAALAQKPPPKHCVQSKDSANAMRAAEPRRRSLIAGLLVGSRPSFLTVGRRLTRLIPLPPRRAVQARRLREAHFVEEFRREKDGSERAIREPAPHYVGNETPLVARTNSLFEMQIRNARSQSALRFDGLRIIRERDGQVVFRRTVR